MDGGQRVADRWPRICGTQTADRCNTGNRDRGELSSPANTGHVLSVSYISAVPPAAVDFHHYIGDLRRSP